MAAAELAAVYSACGLEPVPGSAVAWRLACPLHVTYKGAGLERASDSTVAWNVGGTSSIKVGINGFGRIGRQVVRILIGKHPTYELRHINSTQPADYMKYLLEHDSVHGHFDGTIEVSEGALIINGHKVTLSSTRDASAIPWAASGVDYVAECTGAYLTSDKCQAHRVGGAKKVIISAPAKDDTPTIVVGVNDTMYDSAKMGFVSCASCTTNGLAPLMKVVHERFGIKEALMTTVHAATASQVTVDSTSAKDWRAGRAASSNIIPATTGAAKAVGKCYPALKGKLTGMAVRVPVIDVSMVDVTCVLEQPTTYEAIKAEVKLASETYAKGIVGYTEEAVVSSDFIGETRSTVFDASAGLMLSPTFVKLISWYDNEWGYSTRLCDLIKVMADADLAADAWWMRPAAIVTEHLEERIETTVKNIVTNATKQETMEPESASLGVGESRAGEKSYDSVLSALALHDGVGIDIEMTTPQAMYMIQHLALDEPYERSLCMDGEAVY